MMMTMQSVFAVVVLMLCVPSASAFFAPLGQMRTGIRHSSIGLGKRTMPVRCLSMSSVAVPQSSTTQEPRHLNIQRVRTNEDFISVLAEHKDKLVVVKFYDKFCRACDEIRPRFEDLARSTESDDAAFYEIEFSDSKNLCKQLGIKRLPTVQMYAGADGRVADLPAGPSRFNQVEERFTEVLSTKASESQ